MKALLGVLAVIVLLVLVVGGSLVGSRNELVTEKNACLLYTSPSPRDS